ncbi:MAG: M23 family metallopeptidase [Alphaproteobacteria bacterium]
MSKTIYAALSVLLWSLSLPEPARADGAPLFSFPAQCEVGKTCFIFKYLDADAGPGYHDFNCSLRSSDGHKGTDIAITDPQDITPVKVLAAADGVVVGIRDSLPDNPVGIVNFPEGQNCGNGVRIDHGDGWTTQYCHLRNGKVKVRNGQTVKRGRVIGFLGNSGQTERPHLHFQIEKNGVPVDPFTGKLNTSKSTCAKDKVDLAARSLWTDSAQNKVRLYRPYVIEYIGLSTRVINMETLLQRRQPASGAVGDPLMIVYSSVLGARKGTTLAMDILDPDNETFFSHTETYEKGRARQYRYGGKKRPDGALFKSGAWTARVTISGNGLSGPYEETRTATFTVN